MTDHTTAPPSPEPTELQSRRGVILGGLVAGIAVLVGLILVARSQSEGGGLSVAAAVVQGLVEGLTEFLPVSSTGHLLVANDVMGLGGTDAADRALDAFAICIQVGAILAVVFLYWGRIRQMLDGLVGRSEQGRTVLVAVIAAFVPTAIIGFTLKDIVRDNLFGVGPTAGAWLVGGIAILALTRCGVLARAGTELDSIGMRHAVIIGVGQALALWPGTSRSLVTIVVGVLVGLSLSAAVEFSFLLGLITLTAATVLTALDDGELVIDTFGLLTPAIGLVVAFVAAVASVRWMVAWLERRGLDVFGWYRIGIGVAAVAAMSVGWL